jgi:hypothetical protein
MARRNISRRLRRVPLSSKMDRLRAQGMESGDVSNGFLEACDDFLDSLEEAEGADVVG